MSAPTDLGTRRRRIRPFRHIRKVVKRWHHNFGVRLGLQSGPATHGYMICATQRSGSSYLSQLLASTRCLGNPAEYFNTPAWRKTDSKYPKDPRAQFEIVRSLGATPNGIYGVKAHAFQIARMGEGIDPFRELPNLKLVRLLRSDMLSRAISLSRAKQSRQYSSMSPRLGEPVYSEQSIRHCLLSLLEQESIWNRIFERLGGEFLTLDYQEIVQSPQRTADQVAKFMDVAPAPIDPALIMVTMQRNESSLAWRKRFLADTGDEFRHLAD